MLKSNPPESGIVSLEDLPEDKIFIYLDKDNKKPILNQIKKQDKITLFLSELLIKDWFYGKTKFLRFDKFKYVIKRLNLDLKIKKFGTKQGFLIENKLFKFTNKAGIKFLASVFCDGCVHKKGIRYYNKNKILINDFVKVSKNIFGNINIKVIKNKRDIFVVSLPNICKVIINQLGLVEGSKIVNEISIPYFIYNLKKERLYDFISKLIDDEGFITDGKIYIQMGFKNDKEPVFFNNIRKMLKKLNVNCSIYPIKVYKSISGLKTMWCLGIFSYKDIYEIGKHLNLQHTKKRLKLQSILLNPRKTPYKTMKVYQNIMINIQNSKGFFTVKDLKDYSNRSVRQCRRIINKFKKLNTIQLMRHQCRGYKTIDFAEYRVIN